MKRTEIQSIGDVLRSVLDESNMSLRLAELKAGEIWQEMIGSELASKCMRPYVKNGVMSIRVTDAALRHEFHMQRSSMIRAINRRLNANIISDIRFIG
ncbi:MAG: DUF721 domain-containing protein [Bacteroides sp.]|nr:DUF721 domain-containing protein [Bacteroides sp.]MBD5419315.1 DUF721 domain-containing protein [Bacteroides sp.]MDE7462923.1 DUF721 domain-containing protein [Muribaculaceae bacterium]